ncbi:Gfo/Idh/MocA family protein [Marinicrinis lubricantis]|uniref:Gfo/Idh/MocA family protein n=1 Tax=Marinicrinis lubricantis TaxID=2086470 RepID=A0ABW1IL26_9BACL
MDRLKLGIVGAGAIAKVHASNFSKLEDVELVAITDAFLPLAEKTASEYGIGKVFPNPESLMESNEVDAVIIAVPNKWHAPYAIHALKHNKHVLLEKPMGIDLQSAEEIVQAQKSSGKVMMIPHQMRWEWFSRKAKGLIEEGRMGRIYYAKASYLRRKGIPGWGSWFTRKDEAGGGPLIDIGVHMLDLALYLMGNPKPVSVVGSAYAEMGPHRKGIGNWGTPNWDGYFDVEDLAAAFIKFDNGATLFLEVSWAGHTEIQSSPTIQLMGTDGGATIKGNQGQLHAEIFDEVVDIDLAKPDLEENERVLLSKHFVECIRSGQEPISNVWTGYINNRIIDAIYESSKTGKEVRLDWNE